MGIWKRQWWWEGENGTCGFRAFRCYSEPWRRWWAVRVAGQSPQRADWAGGLRRQSLASLHSVVYGRLTWLKNYWCLFFFLILLRNNWQTSLYKFKTYNLMVWFKYTVKLLSQQLQLTSILSYRYTIRKKKEKKISPYYENS